jgi:DNA invertase Pin-like site-specific DNA recombinase
MKISYLRVSTIEQNEARQIEMMKDKNIDRCFIDKCSAKDTNRPELQKMRDFIENFYQFNKELEECQKQTLALYIESFSRLARNTEDLLALLKEFDSKGVQVISLKENFDTSTPTGKLMVTLIAAIGTFERELMLERQREGISIAKKEGKYKGRKKIEFPPNWINIYNFYKNKTITATEAMRELKLKKNSFYNLAKEYEANKDTFIESKEEIIIKKLPKREDDKKKTNKKR